MDKLTALFQKQKVFQKPAVQERIRILQDLKAAIKQHEKDILQALAHDLHKSEQEAYTTEVGIVYEEINHTLKHLHKWAKPTRVKTPLTHIGSKSMIIKTLWKCAHHCSLELSFPIGPFSISRRDFCGKCCDFKAV